MVRPVFGGGFGSLFQDLLLERIGAQFLLNRLHLLMQEELLLLLVEVGFDLPLDVLFQGQHLLLLVEELKHLLRPLTKIHLFEDALFVLDADLHVASDEVDQKSKAVDALDRFGSLRRDVGVHFDQFRREFPKALHHGLSFFFRQWLIHASVGFNSSLVIRLFLDDLGPLEFLLALQDDGVGAVGHLQHFQNPCDRADGVEVFGSWNLSVVLFLTHYADQHFGFVGLPNQPDASVSPHADWDDDPWKQHGVSQGKQWKHFRDVLLLHGILVLFSEDWNELLVLHVAQSHGLHRLVCIGQMACQTRPSLLHLTKGTPSLRFQCTVGWKRQNFRQVVRSSKT